MADIVAEKFSRLRDRYSEKRKAIKFDFRKFVRANLHVKRSDVFTHNIRSYPGRLFPYIPIFFLSSEEFCPADGKVLDPFSGSGTVLLESMVNTCHKRDVYGVEINPIGRLISKVKTTPIEPTLLDDRINEFFKLLDTQWNDLSATPPQFKNIDLWYSKGAQKGLAKIKTCIDFLDDDDCKDFFWVCFSKLVRDVSFADPCIPPPVLLKIEKYENSYRYKKFKALYERNKNPDTVAIFRDIVTDNAVRIKRLWEIEEIKNNSVKAEIIWDDARSIEKGAYSHKGEVDKESFESLKEQVSLIITSPPYLSAQKYVRATKLEMYWLGMATEKDVHALNKITVGTENVSLLNRKKEIGVESIDETINKIEKHSRERMLIASEYFDNMQKILQRCYDVLKVDGYMVLVLGNNMVGKLTVNTAQLLTDLSKKVGFEDVMIFRDEIKGRGMITKRHGTGGLIKDEYIIVLQKKQEIILQ